MSYKIEVEYLIDNDKMSDTEYENQTEKKFIITEEMIVDLMNSHGCEGNKTREDSIDIGIIKVEFNA